MIRLAKLIGTAMTQGGEAGNLLRRIVAPRLARFPGLGRVVLDSETPALHRSGLVRRPRLRRTLGRSPVPQRAPRGRPVSRRGRCRRIRRRQRDSRPDRPGRRGPAARRRLPRRAAGLGSAPVAAPRPGRGRRRPPGRHRPGGRAGPVRTLHCFSPLRHRGAVMTETLAADALGGPNPVVGVRRKDVIDSVRSVVVEAVASPVAHRGEPEPPDHDRGRRRARPRPAHTRRQGPPVRRPRLVAELLVPPAHGRPPRGRGGTRRLARGHRAVRRGPRAGTIRALVPARRRLAEQPAAEPRRAEAAHRHRWHQRRRRGAAPPRRRAPQRGVPPTGRHREVRGRGQPGHHRRIGGVPQRGPRADPVPAATPIWCTPGRCSSPHHRSTSSTSSTSPRRRAWSGTRWTRGSRSS